MAGAESRLDDRRLGQDWAALAQAEAERGVLTCRVCKRQGPIEDAITIWRNGSVLYGICNACCSDNLFLITPTERGIEVRGKSRTPLVISTR